MSLRITGRKLLSLPTLPAPSENDPNKEIKEFNAKEGSNLHMAWGEPCNNPTQQSIQFLNDHCCKVWTGAELLSTCKLDFPFGYV